METSFAVKGFCILLPTVCIFALRISYIDAKNAFIWKVRVTDVMLNALLVYGAKDVFMALV